MSKRFLVISTAAGLIVVASLAYLLLSRSSNSPVVVEQAVPRAYQSSVDSSDPNPQTPPQTAGKLVDYSAASLASTSGTRLLFFHAPWCPQCRQLEADIKAGSIPANVTIFKVDYDSNQSLRKKYGVTIQTTLVKIDDAGNLVKKYVAYDQPTLAAVESNLL